MQFRHSLALLAALGLSQLAHAASPYGPRQLGAAQGVLDFCAQVDPVDATMFAGRVLWLYRGLTPQQIALVKSGDGFKSAYASVESVLGELPAANAKTVCHAIAPAPTQY